MIDTRLPLLRVLAAGTLARDQGEKERDTETPGGMAKRKARTRDLSYSRFATFFPTLGRNVH